MILLSKHILEKALSNIFPWLAKMVEQIINSKFGNFVIYFPNNIIKMSCCFLEYLVLLSTCVTIVFTCHCKDGTLTYMIIKVIREVPKFSVWYFRMGRYWAIVADWKKNQWKPIETKVSVLHLELKCTGFILFSSFLYFQKWLTITRHSTETTHGTQGH